MKSATDLDVERRAKDLACIAAMQSAAPKLEALRRDSIRRTDTAAAIEALELAYQSERLHGKQRFSSGLVEQQRWFVRGRRQNIET